MVKFALIWLELALLEETRLHEEDEEQVSVRVTTTLGKLEEISEFELLVGLLLLQLDSFIRF